MDVSYILLLRLRKAFAAGRDPQSFPSGWYCLAGSGLDGLTACLDGHSVEGLGRGKSLAERLLSAGTAEDVQIAPHPGKEKLGQLARVVAKWPEAAQVMLDYGLHCVGCGISEVDSIEAGCMVHGMSEEEMEQLLRDINNVVVEVEKNGVKA